PYCGKQRELWNTALRHTRGQGPRGSVRSPSWSAHVVGQALEERSGEGDETGEHPRAEEHQRGRRRDDLRDEGERDLVDLGERLEDADAEAGDEPEEQDGPGEREGQLERAAADGDDS